MARYLFQVGWLLAAALYAWRRGGWPEKAAAALLVAQYAIDRAYHFLFPAPIYLSLDRWHLSLDLFTLGATIVLALRAQRIWTLWFASTQLVASAGHLLRGIDAAMPTLIYQIMVIAPSYLMIALLWTGTALHHRRSLIKRNSLSRFWSR